MEPNLDREAFPERRRRSRTKKPSLKGPIRPETTKRIENILMQVDDEKRTAAVLFVDISEFTNSCDGLRGEELKKVRQLLDRIRDVCGYYVALYNGFIVEFLDDAVLSIFGAPIAYERDAESAVRAALEIRDEISTVSSERVPKIEIKCGIDTGKIKCFIERESGKARLRVSGAAAILAQGLSRVAKTQQILISDATYKFVNRLIECHPMGTRKLKNISHKVTFYEVLGFKPIEPLARDFTTPFVGRRQERKLVQDSIEEAIEGQFKILTISGRAGVGKSRLFVEALKPYKKRIKSLISDGYPYAEKIPFFAITELLKKEFGVKEGDSPAEVSSKIDTYFADLKRFNREDLLYFKFLFSVDEALEKLRHVSPEALHTRIFGLCNQLFQTLARSRPLVVCLDDYQWADNLSREFVRYFIKQRAVKGVFLVLIVRDDYEPAFEQLPAYAHIHLKNLSTAERMELLGSLIDLKFLLPEIRSLILRRSEGSPLYMEELAKALLEVFGPEEIRDAKKMKGQIKEIIPHSLREIIQARIDKLDRQTKLVLQCGAVLGSKFSFNVIDLFDSIHDGLSDQLSGLKALEFVKENPAPKGLEFSFRHPLIQEVAYESMLTKQRKQLHLSIARKLEEIFSGRLTQYYPLLAYHYSRGGDIDKTSFYFIKSAEQMILFFANREAMETLDEAAMLLQETEATPERKLQMIEVLKNKGKLHRLMGEMSEAKEALEASLRLAQEIEDREVEIFVRRELGLVYQQLGDIMPARYSLRSAIELSQQAHLPEEEAQCQNAMGVFLWSLGEHNEALEQFLKVSSAGIDAKLPNLMADALNNAGLIYWKKADYEQALKSMHRALTFRRKARNKFGVAATMMNIGILEENLGHYEKANKNYTDALRLAEKIEYKQVHTAGLSNLGSLALKQGKHNKALEYNSKSLLLAQETDDGRSEAIAFENLALSYIALKKYSEAKETLNQAIRAASKVGDQQCIVSLELASLELALRSDPAVRDLFRIERAINRINASSYTDSLSRAYQIKGQILKNLGNSEEAEKSLLESLWLARKSRNFYDQIESIKALKVLYENLGSRSKANYYAKLLSRHLRGKEIRQ